ncbi:hypothetical protein F5884DRAFT_695131 [Xylogone sp. PMI_703]|nr:hypothetical protein F5884DRAFT_695131 [Xylogone sp. PMI_703]
MVSLTGSKKGHDHETNGAQNHYSDNEGPQPRTSEADERTRLLPPQPREGYLSPDDPAVSPYNLWTIRLLRFFTVIFGVLTFLWWVLLLVSTFVSPPGIHARGSGFLAYSYATLTLGLLLIVLLFFALPSKAAQVTSLVLMVLLLVDIIMIVAVPRLRVEEGWIGIATVVWACLMSIWAVVVDRVVSWGKHEEEERLTGRMETRRTLREWCGVLISTIFLVILAIVVVLISATIILRARDASLPPPGEKYYVDGDKYQIHLYCEGNTTDAYGKKVPTVLFESGARPFEESMINIATNALKNGSISRYCYSDRPGLGWSDNAPAPFSAGMAATALSEALARAGEEGPWVLASAGVGSIYSRIFSTRHGHDVVGLLLIDPLHEDLLHRLSRSNRGFLLWIRGVLSPLGLDRLSGALFRGRTREDRVFGRSSQQNEKYIKAKLQEALVADSLTKNEVASARNIQDQETPLAVISSGIELKKDSEWERKQRDLTHITNQLIGWDIVNKAPAEVWRTQNGREIIEKRLKQLVDV